MLDIYLVSYLFTMAERDALQKRYAYHEMSNKVEQASRSSRRPRDGEATGEVESLRGRAGIGKMGDRVAAVKESRPSELTAKMERAERKRQKREHGATGSSRRGESILAASGGRTILDLGSLTGYQPSTPSARAAYEYLLVRNLCTGIYVTYVSEIFIIFPSVVSVLRM